MRGKSAVVVAVLTAVAGSTAVAQNVVVQWNRNLLAIVRTPGAQPATIHPTRSFAMMHAAIHDAVEAIDQTHQPYLFHSSGGKGASQEAAAASAGHDVLVALYPSFQTTLDQELQGSLSVIVDGPAKQEGIQLGQSAAAAILTLRSHDGSTATPPTFTFGSAPGDYQSTPPNFPKPQFTGWSKVMPFTLNSASQFRPGPPPALTSDTYTAAFNELKTIGMANSTVASTDQKIIGRFWNGAIQNYWNEIAQTAAQARHLSTAKTARLFALLNLSIADTVIAFYDAKYTYQFWRPVTAIRAADTDGNPNTAPDPNWLPATGNTTPDPSYPGAHAAISAAARAVLDSVLETDEMRFAVTSEVLAGFERFFTSISAAEEEASLSRVYAGVHFRTDEDAGTALGGSVAGFALSNFLTPAK